MEMVMEKEREMEMRIGWDQSLGPVMSEGVLVMIRLGAKWVRKVGVHEGEGGRKEIGLVPWGEW